MQRRPMLASALALLSTAALPLRAQSRPVLRLLTHDSFELPPELLKRFEAEAGVQLQIVKGGDAGEMLNRLILTRRKPLADLVFGIDNALLPRALDAGVLDAYDGPAARRPAVARPSAAQRASHPPARPTRRQRSPAVAAVCRLLPDKPGRRVATVQSCRVCARFDWSLLTSRRGWLNRYLL